MRNYGTLELKKNTWTLKAEAHVIVMAKRIFTGAYQAKAGVMSISCTDANCRLLKWLQALYPITCPDQEFLNQRVAETEARLAALERIVQPDHTLQAFEMEIEPRSYQRQAAELYLHGKRLLLADQLGLGKTISAICTLCDPAVLPALIVCPTHLVRQWAIEINRCLPKLNVHILKTGKPYGFDPDKPPDVLISTYMKLSGWSDTLKDYVKSFIADEIQELRHPDTGKYLAAKRMAHSCEYRLGLSATPLYNYGGEIYNPLHILDPGVLGTKEEFDREWCRTGGRHSMLKEPRALNAWLTDQKLMLRRTRTDVGRELPPLTRVVHEIDSDTKALGDIQDAAGELARIILGEGGAGFTKMQAAGEFDMMVRKATGIAKAPYVADFVHLLLESGEPVVMFAWHRAVYDILAERLADHKPVFYTGEETPSQKFQAVQAFVNGETNLIIISLRSGAGIDGLQKRSRIVVIGELDWSPQVIDQCIGRVDRDQQKDPVTAYILVTETGSDPVISQMLGLKKEQSDGVLGVVEPDVLAIQTDQSEGLRKLAEEYLKKRKPK